MEGLSQQEREGSAKRNVNNMVSNFAWQTNSQAAMDAGQQPQREPDEPTGRSRTDSVESLRSGEPAKCKYVVAQEELNEKSVLGDTRSECPHHTSPPERRCTDRRLTTRDSPDRGVLPCDQSCDASADRDLLCITNKHDPRHLFSSRLEGKSALAGVNSCCEKKRLIWHPV